MSADKPIAGRNGVAVGQVTDAKVVKRVGNAEGAGYRTYEIHQRERVGESTEKIKPIQLVSEAYRTNPYPLLEILRDNYPFYRDWLTNSYWVTRYNDVTSIFTDEANFMSRTKLDGYGLSDFGRDYRGELALLRVEERVIDTQGSAVSHRVVADLKGKIEKQGEADLAVDFAGRMALELLAATWNIPDQLRAEFFELYWCAQRGHSWQPQLQRDGMAALHRLVAWFEPLLKARRSSPGEDYLSTLIGIAPEVSARDVVATLLEADHETLHGALANLWYCLLTNPRALLKARSERRLMKLAYLEALRHRPAVLSAYRYARHEVERFGKLIPQGARLVCSAGAANRDPEVFNDPATFVVDRRDLCQREPRGQYRADGLATGIAFGLGKPSIHPAVPEDRPRSRYAQVRDIAVEASVQLSDALPDLCLTAQASPSLCALTVGEMHTCWNLPVTRPQS